MKTVVAIVSVGERPWFGIARRWAEHFCEKWDYDLKIYDDIIVEQTATLKIDRFKTIGRLQKFGVGELFEKYDRIIQIDDTCIISPRIPNVVEMVPEKSIGCLLEGPRRRNSQKFDEYLEDHKRIYDRDRVLEYNRFYNSGFAVYSSYHKSLFVKAAIPFEKIVKDDVFPHQGYMSHAAEMTNIPLFDLGVPFNFVGSLIRRYGLTDKIMNGIYVVHLTSALKQSEREQYAKKLDEFFLKVTDSAN